MSRLRQRDFHAIMEIVEQLYSYQTPDACEAGMVQSLQRVMDCDSLHLSESQPEAAARSMDLRLGARVRPETHPQFGEVVARHMHEHPFLRHWNPSRRISSQPR